MQAQQEQQVQVRALEQEAFTHVTAELRIQESNHAARVWQEARQHFEEQSLRERAHRQEESEAALRELELRHAEARARTAAPVRRLPSPLAPRVAAPEVENLLQGLTAAEAAMEMEREAAGGAIAQRRMEQEMEASERSAAFSAARVAPAMPSGSRRIDMDEL